MHPILALRLFLCVVFAPIAGAQDDPSKPIKLVKASGAKVE